MLIYRDVQPHGNIEEIFSDVFMVTGTNVTVYDGVRYQFSRNMVVVREAGRLCLVNTVRLDESRLKTLDALGKVTDVLRIGAYHGYDDAYYLDRYQARLWEPEGMPAENNRCPDHLITEGCALPQSDMTPYLFTCSRLPEAVIYLNKSGGILISCDSIHNWVSSDQYFSPESARSMEAIGYMGEANLGAGWKQTCTDLKDDLHRLQTLSYQHLLSAHGVPLLNQAYEKLSDTFSRELISQGN